MLNKHQRKVQLELNIRSAVIQVTQPTEILIVWKRGTSLLLLFILGTKKIDTRSKTIDENRH
jgi:hypothetical protein